MNINVAAIDFQELNSKIRNSSEEELTIDNCLGQRYLGCGLSSGKIRISGTPGNALGAYLDGAAITVLGNAQDSVGDTMNDGSKIGRASCRERV